MDEEPQEWRVEKTEKVVAALVSRSFSHYPFFFLFFLYLLFLLEYLGKYVKTTNEKNITADPADVHEPGSPGLAAGRRAAVSFWREKCGQARACSQNCFRTRWSLFFSPLCVCLCFSRSLFSFLRLFW